MDQPVVAGYAFGRSSQVAVGAAAATGPQVQLALQVSLMPIPAQDTFHWPSVGWVGGPSGQAVGAAAGRSEDSAVHQGDDCASVLG